MQASEMPNLFEHFTTSEAYVHIIFIKIVQASEMPNLFEHFATSEGQNSDQTKQTYRLEILTT